MVALQSICVSFLPERCNWLARIRAHRLLSARYVDLIALVRSKLCRVIDPSAEGTVSLGDTEFVHLARLSIMNKHLGPKKTYIRTTLSSPADANIPGSTGFHATALTHPVCPSSVSTRMPFSLCQI